jgi:ElaA protein
MTGPLDVSFVHLRFDDLTLRELHDVLRLRDEVFVVGQRITAEPEVDGLDPVCVHVLGRDRSGRTVATARLHFGGPVAKVGRVAVHPDLQRRGLGTRLMAYVHDVLGDRAATMSAQAHLRDWYEALGWRAEGEIYDEAEIPHVRMTRSVRT